MKKNILIYFLFISTIFPLFAQNGRGTSAELRQQLYNQKKTYIADQVGFTQSESDKFWPLYDELQAKLRESRRVIRTLKRTQNQSKEDYENALKIYETEQKRQDNLRNEYDEKFKTFLSPEKIYKYHMAEESYTKILIYKLEEQRRKGKK